MSSPIQGIGGSSSPQPNSNATVVKSGENLESVAERTGTTVSRLLEENPHLKGREIQAGMEVRVPENEGSGPKPASATKGASPKESVSLYPEVRRAKARMEELLGRNSSSSSEANRIAPEVREAQKAIGGMVSHMFDAKRQEAEMMADIEQYGESLEYNSLANTFTRKLGELKGQVGKLGERVQEATEDSDSALVRGLGAQAAMGLYAAEEAIPSSGGEMALDYAGGKLLGKAFRYLRNTGKRANRLAKKAFDANFKADIAQKRADDALDAAIAKETVAGKATGEAARPARKAADRAWKESLNEIERAQKAITNAVKTTQRAQHAAVDAATEEGSKVFKTAGKEKAEAAEKTAAMIRTPYKPKGFLQRTANWLRAGVLRKKLSDAVETRYGEKQIRPGQVEHPKKRGEAIDERVKRAMPDTPPGGEKVDR